MKGRQTTLQKQRRKAQERSMRLKCDVPARGIVAKTTAALDRAWQDKQHPAEKKAGATEIPRKVWGFWTWKLWP